MYNNAVMVAILQEQQPVIFVEPDLDAVDVLGLFRQMGGSLDPRTLRMLLHMNGNATGPSLPLGSQAALRLSLKKAMAPQIQYPDPYLLYFQRGGQLSEKLFTRLFRSNADDLPKEPPNHFGQLIATANKAQIEFTPEQYAIVNLIDQVVQFPNFDNTVMPPLTDGEELVEAVRFTSSIHPDDGRYLYQIKPCVQLFRVGEPPWLMYDKDKDVDEQAEILWKLSEDTSRPVYPCPVWGNRTFQYRF